MPAVSATLSDMDWFPFDQTVREILELATKLIHMPDLLIEWESGCGERYVSHLRIYPTQFTLEDYVLPWCDLYFGRGEGKKGNCFHTLDSVCVIVIPGFLLRICHPLADSPYLLEYGSYIGHNWEADLAKIMRQWFWSHQLWIPGIIQTITASYDRSLHSSQRELQSELQEVDCYLRDSVLAFLASRGV